MDDDLLQVGLGRRNFQEPEEIRRLTDQEIVIAVSVLAAAWVVLMVAMLVLFCQISNLKKKLNESKNSRLRIQKLRMDDKNHAFQNPALVPDEELSRRGYSMYMGPDTQTDVENGSHQPERQWDWHQERQTGGQFVEELIHEMDNRQLRQQSNAPPFLLQNIQENKMMMTRNNLNGINNAKEFHCPPHPLPTSYREYTWGRPQAEANV